MNKEKMMKKKKEKKAHTAARLLYIIYTTTTVCCIDKCHPFNAKFMFIHSFISIEPRETGVVGWLLIYKRKGPYLYKCIYATTTASTYLTH